MVERDGVRFTLLGTAHVSQSSTDAVRAALASGQFDAVAVELCPARRQALADPASLSSLDLFSVIREGKAGLVAASLALAAYQRRLGEQLGVEPGAEMRAALDDAESLGLPCWLIDRDVGTTLKRTWRGAGFWQRSKLIGALLGSLVVGESIDEAEIERLKQGDLLESAFSEFARQSEPLYRGLIAERDRYMAAALRQHAAGSDARHVLVVVGAGHLEGLATHLADDRDDPVATRAGLERVPPPGWLSRAWPWLLIAFVLGGFAIGFARGVDIGAGLVWQWVLITAVLGALGAAAAAAHPLSIVSAALASPLTPLHPALASGMVSAATELWLRKPRVADFSALRDDLQRVSGWWRNAAARIFLVFLMTSLGTALGVYIAGYRIIDALL
ncbi:MAG TPA: TraB/GumN family protein [Xanthomonadaceae bacterium]|nr:TraB/GumN family protein [Xanthomonadaceae bacterium]